MIRVGGITTVVVAGATAACGLLMLGGVAPAPADADLDGESAPAAIVNSSLTDASVADVSTSDPTVPDSTAPDSTAPDPTVQTDIADPPAPQAAADPPPPIPLSVSPSSVTVGVGGTARISGECPTVDASPLGPVVIWEIGDTVTVIPTGVTAASWSYDWTAPAVAQPLALQVWCGDPSAYAGGYPEALQIEVVFVAQEAPTTTTTVAAAPHTEIPETG